MQNPSAPETAKSEGDKEATSLPMFVASANNLQPEENALDLDELFQDCYFGDFPVPAENGVATIQATAPVVPATATAAAPTPLVPNNQFYTEAGSTEAQDAAASAAVVTTTTAAPGTATATTTTTNSNSLKRKAEDALSSPQQPIQTQSLPQAQITAFNNTKLVKKEAGSTKPLTDQQKVERRERNRKHAKRSRLRKKFLLESLQDQINGLQSEIESLKGIIRKECPTKAEELLESVSGPKGKFTPLPMPSGFGPVKTLMQPDFRLMSALSGSQQNFAISDPSLPDNPIVYVSQGFLDLTGYKLDQVLGRNCRFLQGPGTDQSAVDIIRKGVREGVDTSVCLLNYKADGTPFWNQFFVAALRDAENNVVNFVGVQCEVSKAVVDQQIAEQKERAEAEAAES